MIDPSFGLALSPVLAGLTVLAICLYDWRMAGIGAVLWLDLAACTYLPGTDPQKPFGYAELPTWAVIDLLAGFAVVALSKSRIGLVITALFAVQVIAHLVYGIPLALGDWFRSDDLANPSDMVQSLYWDSTHWASWLQAWVMLFWISRDGYALVDTFASRHSAGRAVDDNYGQVGEARLATDAELLEKLERVAL